MTTSQVFKFAENATGPGSIALRGARERVQSAADTPKDEHGNTVTVDNIPLDLLSDHCIRAGMDNAMSPSTAAVFREEHERRYRAARAWVEATLNT